MADEGSSSTGAEGGSDKFSSNRELLKHYEDQVFINLILDISGINTFLA